MFYYYFQHVHFSGSEQNMIDVILLLLYINSNIIIMLYLFYNDLILILLLINIC